MDAILRPAGSRSGRDWTAATALCLLAAAASAGAAESDLAQELTNPIADLVTLPIQMNYDQGIGPSDDGTKITTNVQPVIPFDHGENWNLITRTIVLPR